MLPKLIKSRLIEKMSVKTMRYVDATPTREADGLTKRVYDMVEREAFINGSVTSHSKVPELMAGMWTGAREVILVTDRLDRTTKEAMATTMSHINKCPYCADMLISLVHANDDHNVARAMFNKDETQVKDKLTRERCEWTRAMITEGWAETPNTLFTKSQLPEAIGALFVFSYINRFNHVVMDGSPVTPPLGLGEVRSTALRFFGNELSPTTSRPLDPGHALNLLPPDQLPDDLNWAIMNPRVSDALARWVSTVEREASIAVPIKVRNLVEKNVRNWNGERMPLDRRWIDQEMKELSGYDRKIARIALAIAKSFHQVDEKMVVDVLGNDHDQQQLIRVLAWSSMLAARNISGRIWKAVKEAPDESERNLYLMAG